MCVCEREKERTMLYITSSERIVSLLYYYSLDYRTYIGLKSTNLFQRNLDLIFTWKVYTCIASCDHVSWMSKSEHGSGHIQFPFLKIHKRIKILFSGSLNDYRALLLKLSIICSFLDSP